MSVTDIKAAAEARIRDLVMAGDLGLEDGRVDGIHWLCRNPQRADRTIGSFVVDLGGKAPGRFKDFASDEGGDVIDLVSYCLAGPGRYKEREARGQAIAWLGRWTGLETRPGKPLSPAEREAQQRRLAEARAARQAEHEASLADRARSARRWWLKHGQPIGGTPVETYLEQVRGVPLAGLPLTGAIRALGPSAAHPRWAMFSAMAKASEVTAVHITYLTPDGRKDETADPVKKMWGDVKGAVVRVSKGALGLSPEAAAKKGRSASLALCEGIEDALTLAMLWPDWQVWAAGTVGNLEAVAASGWPACASDLVLVQDNDGVGSAADLVFARAVEAWVAAAAGRKVSVLKPREFKDINDLWRATA